MSDAEKERKKDTIQSYNTIQTNKQQTKNVLPKCVICGSEGQQIHHLKYEPEITIPVCVKCHLEIHAHGVGSPIGGCKEPVIEAEQLPIPPTYTKEALRGETFYILTLNDKMLIKPTCPNDGSWEWQLFTLDGKEFFLRCVKCGFDFKLRREFNDSNTR